MKISKRAKLAYIKKKYIGKSCQPKNIQFELEDGYEFGYAKKFGKQKLTIIKKK